MGIYWAALLPYFFYFFGILVFFVTLFKVEFGILFLIPMLPLQTVLDRMQAFPFGKDFVDIFIMVMIVGWIIGKAIRGEKIFEKSGLNILLFLLILYTFFSFYHGFSSFRNTASLDFRDPRMQTWKNYIILPIIYLLVLNNIKEKRHLRWLTLLMIGVIFAMSLRFFREYRWIDKSFFRNEMRWSGVFSYLGPNEYAAFFSHYIFILIGLLIFIKSKLKKAFLFLAIILNSYCILFLFSRGSYLAAFIGLAIIGILRRNIILIIILAGLIFSYNTLLPKAVVERVEMTRNEYGELENSAQMRVNVWKRSLDLFLLNPVIGIGFNTFPFLGFQLGDTHNLYIKILLEQGVIGLFLFLLIIFFALASSWRLYRKAKDNLLKGIGFGFFFCTISLLISNYFGDRWTYLPLGAYFWAFMGLVGRANIITQKELSGNNSLKKRQPK